VHGWEDDIHLEKYIYIYIYNFALVSTSHCSSCYADYTTLSYRSILRVFGHNLKSILFLDMIIIHKAIGSCSLIRSPSENNR